VEWKVKKNISSNLRITTVVQVTKIPGSVCKFYPSCYGRFIRKVVLENLNPLDFSGYPMFGYGHPQKDRKD
jgi:hypothetical protein